MLNEEFINEYMSEAQEHLEKALDALVALIGRMSIAGCDQDVLQLWKARAVGVQDMHDLVFNSSYSEVSNASA